ncbi:hypothetical protein TRFO_39643 [Tritrichomonas foetus]|uniref:Uncharacterized protein n=1 Tax=Tritrichomonas foetus TaxID=1144522 RepID=A0A1J4J8Z3_9EUKA|nr:hypothetical protein TRFO_39643 [Tritrichomonas foetus]|eukprot:OHS94155.1 hypothetical protein TRFO_39643 [Tritrichomonas foetus]
MYRRLTLLSHNNEEESVSEEYNSKVRDIYFVDRNGLIYDKKYDPIAYHDTHKVSFPSVIESKTYSLYFKAVKCFFEEFQNRYDQFIFPIPVSLFYHLPPKYPLILFKYSRSKFKTKVVLTHQNVLTVLDIMLSKEEIDFEQDLQSYSIMGNNENNDIKIKDVIKNDHIWSSHLIPSLPLPNLYSSYEKFLHSSIKWYKKAHSYFNDTIFHPSEIEIKKHMFYDKNHENIRRKSSNEYDALSPTNYRSRRHQLRHYASQKKVMTANSLNEIINTHSYTNPAKSDMKLSKYFIHFTNRKPIASKMERIKYSLKILYHNSYQKNAKNLKKECTFFEDRKPPLLLNQNPIDFIKSSKKYGAASPFNPNLGTIAKGCYSIHAQYMKLTIGNTLQLIDALNKLSMIPVETIQFLLFHEIEKLAKVSFPNLIKIIDSHISIAFTITQIISKFSNCQFRVINPNISMFQNSTVQINKKVLYLHRIIFMYHFVYLLAEHYSVQYYTQEIASHALAYASTHFKAFCNFITKNLSLELWQQLVELSLDLSLSMFYIIITSPFLSEINIFFKKLGFGLFRYLELSIKSNNNKKEIRKILGYIQANESLVKSIIILLISVCQQFMISDIYDPLILSFIKNLLHNQSFLQNEPPLDFIKDFKWIIEIVESIKVNKHTQVHKLIIFVKFYSKCCRSNAGNSRSYLHNVIEELCKKLSYGECILTSISKVIKIHSIFFFNSPVDEKAKQILYYMMSVDENLSVAAWKILRSFVKIHPKTFCRYLNNDIFKNELSKTFKKMTSNKAIQLFKICIYLINQYEKDPKFWKKLRKFVHLLKKLNFDLKREIRWIMNSDNFYFTKYKRTVNELNQILSDSPKISKLFKRKKT